MEQRSQYERIVRKIVCVNSRYESDLPLIEDNDIVNAISQNCNVLKSMLYDEISLTTQMKTIIERFDNIDKLLSQYINKQAWLNETI